MSSPYHIIIAFFSINGLFTISFNKTCFGWQFQRLNAEEKVSNELRESLSAYMLEAGLEPELLCGGRDILLQGLLWYFVIDKRKLELDDIAKGNYDKIYINMVQLSHVFRPCINNATLSQHGRKKDCQLTLSSQ